MFRTGGHVWQAGWAQRGSSHGSAGAEWSTPATSAHPKVQADSHSAGQQLAVPTCHGGIHGDGVQQHAATDPVAVACGRAGRRRAPGGSRQQFQHTVFTKHRLCSAVHYPAQPCKQRRAPARTGDDALSLRGSDTVLGPIGTNRPLSAVAGLAAGCGNLGHAADDQRAGKATGCGGGWLVRCGAVGRGVWTHAVGLRLSSVDMPCTAH